MNKTRKKTINKLISEGKIDEALSLTTVNDLDYLFSLGDLFYEQNKFLECVEICNRIIFFDSKEESAWYNKGVALDNLEKYDQAIECFEKVIEINPKHDGAWSNKGVALGRLGKHDQAIECYEKAIEINPKHENAWYNKGFALANLEKYDQAIECYEKAIEINPKNENAWYNKGFALDNLEKYDQAIECFEKVIEINPKEESAWSSKGVSLGKLEKYDQAIECFEKVIEINPKHDGAWSNKGVALNYLEKYDQAIECYEKAIEINPKNENIWSNKGKVLSKLKKIDDALKSFGHAYLLNKGIQLGEDYSLGLAEPVRMKELEIISHSLEEIKKDWVKISLVQLNYSLELNVHPKDFGYILKDEESVRIKVLKALNLAKEESVDLICFPELSTKEEWIEEIKEQYEDMIIVFGSYYKDGFNICPIIINGTAYNYQKINPSPNFEIETIADRCMKKGKNVFVFQTKCGTIIVLNCMDYLKEIHSILDGLEKKGITIDLIIVPQYNKSVRLFQEHANHVCQAYNCPYILHINAHEVLKKKVDGTSVIGLEHNGALENYKMSKIKPDDNIRFKLFEISGEKMMIFELDLKNRGNILPARGPKIRCVKEIPLK